MESPLESPVQSWTQGKYPLYVDASTTFREPLEQLLLSVVSALRSIHGKDGSLSLTVSTDTGTLSVDMKSRSRESLVAELTQIQGSLKLQQSRGTPWRGWNSC